MNEKELNDKMIEELEGILQSMKEQRDKLLEAPVTDVLTEEQWNHVIDERYICKFWDSSNKDTLDLRISYLADQGLSEDYEVYTDSSGTPWEDCEVYRVKGIKQPHFRGQPPPEIGSDNVLIYYEDGVVHMVPSSDLFNWDDIVAFIEV